MMEKITGKIEKVESSTGTGAKGPWKRFAFTIDGKVYSTFDAKIGDNYIVGMDVVMEGEQSGQYWNMKTMMPASTPEHAEEYAKAGIEYERKNGEIMPPKPTSLAQDRNNSIIAQVMLKCEYRNCAAPKPIEIMESYQFYLRELSNG